MGSSLLHLNMSKALELPVSESKVTLEAENHLLELDVKVVIRFSVARQRLIDSVFMKKVFIVLDFLTSSDLLITLIAWCN